MKLVKQSVELAFSAGTSGIACLLLSCLVACGGGGSSGGEGGNLTVAVGVTPPPAVAQAQSSGTLLNADWITYSRLVRLEHQAETSQNGLVLAVATERVSGLWRPTVHVSEDQGVTFTPRAAVQDPDFPKGVCCGSLFELPQAVGVLPAGTLIYSASVGYDVAGTLMENRVYVSRDSARSFQRLEGVNCGTSSVPKIPQQPGSGVWEPEFFIGGDGSLACIFSDETVPGKSQVLKLTRSMDGATWSAPGVIVAGDESTARPGMTSVRKLPSGRYAMTFESCGTAVTDCAVHVKVSDDGLNWGAVNEMGVRPQTADGYYFLHTPTLTGAMLSGKANGRLILIGQLVASDAAGVDPTRTGRVMLVNDDFEGSGKWKLARSPLGLATAPSTSNWCQNYSSPLVASANGNQILMLQTDLAADGGCNVRYGSNTLSNI